MPSEFVKVARISEIPEKRSKRIHLDNEEIALWRVNGNVYAVNNVCPHQHIPALHQATLKEITITCPISKNP